MSVERRTQTERRAATRAALMDAARALLVEKGFAEMGTPEIVRRAGVTRGALYHHFDGKAELFEAVARAEADAVAEAVARASGGSAGEPEGGALGAGTAAYLDAMEVPGRARILLVDAPAALGPVRAQQIADAAGGEALRAALSSAAAGPEEARALALLVSAAFDRAALLISSGAPRAPVEAAAARLLERLASGPG